MQSNVIQIIHPTIYCHTNDDFTNAQLLITIHSSKITMVNVLVTNLFLSTFYVATDSVWTMLLILMWISIEK